MRERELRRWGNAWVVIAGVFLFVTPAAYALGVTDRTAADSTYVWAPLIIANILWLRADNARGRA